MTDAKEPESVRALRRIRELYADVDAWVTWADDGQLLEAYAGELLDHIDALTRERDEERAVIEAAKAIRDVPVTYQFGSEHWIQAFDKLDIAVTALRALEGDA